MDRGIHCVGEDSLAVIPGPGVELGGGIVRATESSRKGPHLPILASSPQTPFPPSTPPCPHPRPPPEPLAHTLLHMTHSQPAHVTGTA